jgi:molecular chaperone IbpA
MSNLLSSPILGNILGFEFGNDPFKETSYPPYNVIQKGDDRYIELAVAGFSEDELSVTFQRNVLSVRTLDHAEPSDKDGPKVDAAKANDVTYIRKGISTRPFNICWKVSPEFNVSEATYLNGILKIKLEYNPPEELKPRTIAIQRSDRSFLTEDTSLKGKKKT